jgi:hypothetical protein
MIQNTLTEIGGKDEFLGHLGSAEFVLIAPTVYLSSLQERLRNRLTQSLDYFYPIKDRERASRRPERLGVKMSEIPTVKGHFASVDKLKVELLRLKN